MSFKPRKTKIQRVARNEEIMVKIMSEPFQERFEEIRDIEQEFANLCEDAQIIIGSQSPDVLRESNLDLAKKIDVCRHEAHIKNNQFWMDVRTTYDLWGHILGVRDGYSIVRIMYGKGPMQIFTM